MTPLVHPWYAVRVKSNFERTTADILREKGLEEFLPTYKSRRRWSDRVKELHLPIFPGYVFCRVDMNNRLPVLITPGVVDIVSLGKVPIAVPDEEIEAVRRTVQTSLAYQPWPFLKAGQRVLLKEGPLAGVEGDLIEVKENYRLVISISLLQRSMAVEIDRAWVTPVSKPAVPGALAQQKAVQTALSKPK
jgi:transcription antitermination factor NusG